MTLVTTDGTQAPLANAALAAGLFGGARDAARRDEPLALPASEASASRRQSFSVLFRADACRADGAQLHAA